MDAKDLRIETALGERNDGSKYSQSGVAVQNTRNKPYQDIGSNTLAKAEATVRPCAVIGPDRVVPPPASNEAYVKKGSLDVWSCPENTYHRPPEYPHKPFNNVNPLRNISPRQTFQENMPRIMVSPTYNSNKHANEANLNSIQDANTLAKSTKQTLASESKYCDVPYNVNYLPNEPKNVRETEICVPNVNSPLTRQAPHAWPPSGVNLHASRMYGAHDMYQYPQYPSCTGPRPPVVPVPRPHRTFPEEPSYVYPDSYYQDTSVRYKPYPTVKERYPQTRYDYISNYPTPFHSPPYLPPKYDMPSTRPHPYSMYPHLKYMENRVPETNIDGYQRSNQNYNMPIRNHVIHPPYQTVIGNTQNKVSSYPEAAMKTQGKPPYDANKTYIDYENTKLKYSVPEFYVNDMSRTHQVQKPIPIPNYPSPGMHSMQMHQYQRKDINTIKAYDYMPHLRHFDHPMGFNPSSHQTHQFSPSAIAISPTDSTNSTDNHNQGPSQQDYGYVSQSSSASVRSMESSISRFQNEYYRRHDYRNQPIYGNPPTLPKLDNSSTSSKDNSKINVRQFLSMWNEGDDDAASHSKDVPKLTDPNNVLKGQETIKNQDQLYVLGLVNVPNEELPKYQHIQKVSKLPENIKGYNNIELLNQFEEVIEFSNMNNYKYSNTKELMSSKERKNAIKRIVEVLPRPVSPLDVEAKISQSVIHKEVGCNFEIKPCSPKMLNVEVASPIQNILDERVIEKVTNPLKVKAKSPLSIRIEGNAVSHKTQRHENKHIVYENSSCKMISSPFTSNSMDPVKTNYSLQDLETNSGVCLASLPRLDNEIELNFPEVNQQFINANKGDGHLFEKYSSNMIKDNMIPNTNNDAFNLYNSTEIGQSEIKQTENDKSGYQLDHETGSNANAVRKDSVIIENPENVKKYEDKHILSKQEVNYSAPMNLTQYNVNKTDAFNDSKLNPSQNERALDFSRTKPENDLPIINPYDDLAHDMLIDNLNSDRYSPRSSNIENKNINLKNVSKMDKHGDNHNLSHLNEKSKDVDINITSNLLEQQNEINIEKKDILKSEPCRKVIVKQKGKKNKKVPINNDAKVKKYVIEDILHDRLDKGNVIKEESPSLDGKGQKQTVTILRENNTDDISAIVDSELKNEEYQKSSKSAHSLNTTNMLTESINTCADSITSKNLQNLKITYDKTVTPKNTLPENSVPLARKTGSKINENAFEEISEISKNSKKYYSDLISVTELLLDKCSTIDTTKEIKDDCNKSTSNLHTSTIDNSKTCNIESQSAQELLSIPKIDKVINIDLDISEDFGSDKKSINISPSIIESAEDQGNFSNSNENIFHDGNCDFDKVIDSHDKMRNNQNNVPYDCPKKETEFQENKLLNEYLADEILATKNNDNNKKETKVENVIEENETNDSDLVSAPYSSADKKYAEKHSVIGDKEMSHINKTKVANTNTVNTSNVESVIEVNEITKSKHFPDLNPSAELTDNKNSYNAVSLDEKPKSLVTWNDKRNNSSEEADSATDRDNKLYSNGIKPEVQDSTILSCSNTTATLTLSDTNSDCKSNHQIKLPETPQISDDIYDDIDNNMQMLFEPFINDTVTKEVSVTEFNTKETCIDHETGSSKRDNPDIEANIQNNADNNMQIVFEPMNNDTETNEVPDTELNIEDTCIDHKTGSCKWDNANIEANIKDTVDNNMPISFEPLNNNTVTNEVSDSKPNIKDTFIDQETGSSKMDNPDIDNNVENNMKILFEPLNNITVTNKVSDAELSIEETCIDQETGSSKKDNPDIKADVENNVDNAMLISFDPLNNDTVSNEVSDAKLKIETGSTKKDSPEIEENNVDNMQFLLKPLCNDTVRNEVSETEFNVRDTFIDHEKSLSRKDNPDIEANMENKVDNNVPILFEPLNNDTVSSEMSDTLLNNKDTCMDHDKTSKDTSYIEVNMEDIVDNTMQIQLEPSNSDTVTNEVSETEINTNVTCIDHEKGLSKIENTDIEFNMENNGDSNVKVGDITLSDDSKSESVYDFSQDITKTATNVSGSIVKHVTHKSLLRFCDDNHHSKGILPIPSYSSVNKKQFSILWSKRIFCPFYQKLIMINEGKIKKSYDIKLDLGNIGDSDSTIVGSESNVGDTNFHSIETSSSNDKIMTYRNNTHDVIPDVDSSIDKDYDSNYEKDCISECTDQNDLIDSQSISFTYTNCSIISQITKNILDGNDIVERCNEGLNYESSCIKNNVICNENNNIHSLDSENCTKDRFSQRPRPLKRSFSDSDLNKQSQQNRQELENLYSPWRSKRNKIEGFANLIHNNRRNSVNFEDNVSFCILIDEDCIITEENEEKICIAELPGNYIETTEVDTECNVDVTVPTNELYCCTDESSLDCSNSQILVCEKESAIHEPWIDDIGCVETVYSDEVAENVVISAPTSPSDTSLEIFSEDPDNYENASTSYADKVKLLHDEKMSLEDAQVVDALYRTPHMDIMNKTLLYGDKNISDSDTNMSDDEQENVILESDDWKASPTQTPDYIDPSHASSEFRLETPENKENVFVKDLSPLRRIDDYLDVSGAENENDENISPKLLEYATKHAQDGTIHSSESTLDDVFDYKVQDHSSSLIASSCTTSSSPEVSSTTSEEKSSSILLKITNLNGSIVSQLNDVEQNNRPRCKFTEKIEYSASSLNFPNRPLMTKAAQKYIPPIKESIRDLKVSISLPQQRLIKLKQLKLCQSELKPKVRQPHTVPRIIKKPKPNFDDVLKSIDEIHYKKHKEKNKKSKSVVPKVVIKKSENGSHYASTRKKEIYNPDLTGRKWQPWVFLEKNLFIDKMATRNKTKAIFNHRKNAYILAEKFKKYKSVSSTKFIITHPKTPGELKYTIRLKHAY